MRFVWNPNKRRRNIEVHGLDLNDAQRARFSLLVDVEFVDGEEREVFYATLSGRVVVIVTHRRSEEEVRVISMRPANRIEQQRYYRNV